MGNLRTLAKEEPLLQQAEADVEVVVCQPATLVPLADFREEDCQEIYNTCFAQTGEARRVFYDTVPQSNIVLLFAFSVNACRALEETFSSVHYVNAQTALLRHYASLEAGKMRPAVYVNLHSSYADVAVFEREHLLLSNSYDVRDEHDVAYYALGAARLVGAAKASTEYFVAGEDGARGKVVGELAAIVAGVEALEAKPLKGKQQRRLSLPYDFSIIFER